MTVYDMGKNSSGWPEILVRGRAGGAEVINTTSAAISNPIGFIR
jgi:hypothetical protein